MFQRVSASFALSIVPGALCVGVVGFLDDRRGVSVVVRLAVHLGAVLLFLAISGGSVTKFGLGWLDGLPILVFVLEVLALTWLLNLFNFMDGIDGIAGVEGLCVASGFLLVACLTNDGRESMLLASLLAAASVGFLVWNWPPAKVFMGDVGSGFMGLTLGMLSMHAMRELQISVWVPLIFLGVFVTDATFTLIRRVLRGEAPYSAHRTHAYQWLCRRWRSHLTVTLAVLAINIGWLLPLGVAAAFRPQFAAALAAVAYAPLLAAVVWAGGGRPEV
jgi:Fuc2NAc and GlcNAc transferase